MNKTPPYCHQPQPSNLNTASKFYLRYQQDQLERTDYAIQFRLAVGDKTILPLFIKSLKPIPHFFTPTRCLQMKVTPQLLFLFWSGRGCHFLSLFMIRLHQTTVSFLIENYHVHHIREDTCKPLSGTIQPSAGILPQKYFSPKK